jgi:hypothetical protein
VINGARAWDFQWVLHGEACWGFEIFGEIDLYKIIEYIYER